MKLPKINLWAACRPRHKRQKQIAKEWSCDSILELTVSSWKEKTTLLEVQY